MPADHENLKWTPKYLEQVCNELTVDWQESVCVYNLFLCIHNHFFHLLAVFSHLWWGWTGDGCFPHSLILRHMLLHSQQNHILHHTLGPLFPRPRPSLRLSSPNSHLPHVTQHISRLPFSHVQTIPSTNLKKGNKKFTFCHICIWRTTVSCLLSSLSHPVTSSRRSMWQRVPLPVCQQSWSAKFSTKWISARLLVQQASSLKCSKLWVRRVWSWWGSWQR